LNDKTVLLSLNNEFSNVDLRYVLGDANLTANVNKYVGPIKLAETTIVKASIFKNNRPIGAAYVDTIKFHNAVGKDVKYTEEYSDSYKGQGVFNLVNTLRGTKNFHDGQWQGWIENDMEIVIDLEKEQSIHQIVVGSIENQGSGIYFPIQIDVLTSVDGTSFQKQGEIKRDYQQNGNSELKDFKVGFKETKSKFVKVKVARLKNPPNRGGAWLFIDEVLVD